MQEIDIVILTSRRPASTLSHATTCTQTYVKGLHTNKVFLKGLITFCFIYESNWWLMFFYHTYILFKIINFPSMVCLFLCLFVLNLSFTTLFYYSRSNFIHLSVCMYLSKLSKLYQLIYSLIDVWIYWMWKTDIKPILILQNLFYLLEVFLKPYCT